MKKYDPKTIEPNWQQTWADTKLYAAVTGDTAREKYYMLTEFPYPSGAGLHAGHTREYTLGDVIARHKRMQGFNVLYPMGYDAFGLPTENFAIKHKIRPQDATSQNVEVFRQQFDSLGLSFDWDREVNTTHPDYYRWTQWLFLKFHAAGLAYQAEMPINWCPKEKTGLSNEEVVDGKHERCGTPVEKKLIKQWMLKITAYADRLIEGLKTVDYPSRIADQQVNWIGRSEGAEIDFLVGESGVAPKDSLKFTPELTKLVLDGSKTNTVRLEPKNLQVGDIASLITRLSPTDTQVFAQAKVTKIETMPLGQIPLDLDGHEPFASTDEQLAAYRGYYGDTVGFDTEFTIYYFDSVQPTVTVYTTRPDTLAGATFLVLAPEHAAVAQITTPDQRSQVEAYVKKAQGESEIDRQNTDRTKTGVFTGAYSANPITGAKVPVWIADYVLASYGTGAIMAVPAHDERDFAFAKAFKLDIQQVVSGDDLPAVATGKLINSGQFDGLEGAEAKRAIVKYLEDKGSAKTAVKYKLRDWIFSRQHYWGEPIPIVHCEHCGAVPVPEDQLPITLPDVEHYEPTETGESPLAAITDWVNTACPKCDKPAKRETDTMPNWAGSSWYYLRYMDAHNDQAFASPEALKYWGEVDLYLGGMEHTTLHLLYSRFWHQFFYDQGLVPTPEPYAARRGQGIVLAADGRKMSKSIGNVVNPTDIIASYGADTLRLYILFMAPYDETTPWSEERLAGASRFVWRVWALAQELIEAHAFTRAMKPGPGDAFETEVDRATHKAIKKVHDELGGMRFNTAVSALMEYVNFLSDAKTKARLLEPASAALAWRALNTLVQLLAPITPHMSEELWHQLGYPGSVHVAGWPEYDPELIKDDVVVIVVQVNGKVRANLAMTPDATQSELAEAAKADPNVAKYLQDGQLLKTIVVPRKLVNFVVK